MCEGICPYVFEMPDEAIVKRAKQESIVHTRKPGMKKSLIGGNSQKFFTFESY